MMPSDRHWFDEALRESDFLERYPHFVGIISRLNVRFASAIDVMAIALKRADRPEGTLNLYINRSFFKENPQYFSGILIHELHHASLGHLNRAELHTIEDPRSMEIAMEVSANEFIVEPLPDPIVWQAFEKFGIRPFQSTMDRYSLIRDAVKSGRLELPSKGRCAGQHRVFGGSRGGTEQGLGDALDRLSRDSELTVPSWELGLPTHEDDLLIMREQLEEHLGGSRGNPFGVSTGDSMKPRQDRRNLTSEEAAEKPLSWPHILQMAFPLQRQAQPSYMRPNRRFINRLGEVPGRSRRRPKPRLLVAVDTSGSMSEHMLSVVAHEVSRLGHYAVVSVAECDAAVHRQYKLSEPMTHMQGGGDTDFGPGLEAADASQSDSRFDGVVYFTDGKGSWPETLNATMPPVLWVLTNEDPFDCAYGARVRLLMHEA